MANQQYQLDWNDLRPQVRQFAVLMELELRANDYKGGWEQMSGKAIFHRILEELAELYEVVHAPLNPRAVVKEAVDIPNYIMMLLDSRGLLALAKSAGDTNT